jgi:predicted lipoprotein
MMANRRSNRRPFIVLAVTAGAVLCWRFPPFHVVSLKRVREQRPAEAFDAKVAAATEWNAKVIPAAEHGVEVTELIAALARNAAGARQRHGRSGDLGGSTFFAVKGVGRVSAVNENAVVVGVDGGDVKVRLTVGPIFGSVVRDASGLSDASAYPSSQDFNDLSAELNRIVETQIEPELIQKARPGTMIRFAGCAELEEDATADSLVVVPVKIEWP